MTGYYLIVTAFLLICAITEARYQPNWKSLDSRPLPSWYDEAKFGVFIHWGVFSVPSFGNTGHFWWYWKATKEKSVVDFMKRNYPPTFTYADFAPMFKAEFYNPNEWADIFKASGAKYMVLVAKHHEGFCNWPTEYSFNWNSMDVGPNRDLVGELASAIRNKTDIRFGLYHSMYEFFHPLYLEDKRNGFKTQKFVEEKTMPELYELVNKYKPEVVWSDGDGEAPDTYWNSTGFLAWLYNSSPVKDTVVVNDRWGRGILCHHGDYYTCTDRYNPGKLLKHKWENCMTIDRGSWGFRRNVALSDFLDMDELTATLAETVSCGGNLLMNVGPTSDGRIVPIFEERLRQMGSWLKVNGEAIYSSKPWKHQNDNLTKGVWYTSKKGQKGTNVYAILLDWPKGNVLSLGAPAKSGLQTVTVLGYPKTFTVKKSPTGGIDIMIPAMSADQLPCQWAWTFKLQYTS